MNIDLNKNIDHDPWPVRTNVPLDEKSKYRLPVNLSDGNQDGLADEGDFIRSFENLELTIWEI